MTTYEGVLARIHKLVPAPSERERSVDWVDEVGLIGVARTSSGRIELFLVGPELAVTHKGISEHLVYKQYFRKDGEPFTASRLELPLAGHFDQVAAFICVELVRNGSSIDLAAAFSASEPVIDLALETLNSSDSWLRGLVAELALLNAMVQQAPPAVVPVVLECWSGYQPSLRDFSVNGVGVEVKATARGVSTHAMNGLHQGEPQPGENFLFLTSFVGLVWQGSEADDPTVLTGRKLVEQVVSRIVESGHPATLAEQFKFQVAEYLPNSSESAGPLDRPFKWSAVRTYDVADHGIQILTSDDVARRPNTVLASVRFDVALPDQVTGDINPVVGLNKSAAMILDKASLGITTS